MWNFQLCSFIHWSIWVTCGSMLLASHLCCWRLQHLALYVQTFESFFFVPAMLIGIIDFNHFLLLSVTLTLPWGYKVRWNQNLLALYSYTVFSWSTWSLLLFSSWWSWYYIWVGFINQGKWLLSHWWRQKNFKVGFYGFGQLWTRLLQTWCVDKYQSLHSDSSLSDCDLYWKSQVCKKQKTFRTSYLTKVDWFGWNLVCCRGLICLMSLMFNLSDLICFQAR